MGPISLDPDAAVAHRFCRGKRGSRARKGIQHDPLAQWQRAPHHPAHEILRLEAGVVGERPFSGTRGADSITSPKVGARELVPCSQASSSTAPYRQVRS